MSPSYHVCCLPILFPCILFRTNLQIYHSGKYTKNFLVLSNKSNNNFHEKIFPCIHVTPDNISHIPCNKAMVYSGLYWIHPFLRKKNQKTVGRLGVRNMGVTQPGNVFIFTFRKYSKHA